MITGRPRALLRAAIVIGTLLGTTVVSGCNSQLSQLSVALTAVASGPIAPGDSPEYTLSVVNKGPGSVLGLGVRVSLPAGLTYKATRGISGFLEERTQLTDAAVHSQTPQWGLWSLPAPTRQADGTVRNGELDLTFTVDVAGAPGGYQMTAVATSESAEGAATPAPLAVQIAPAAHISMAVAAAPGNVHPNDTVTYTITITNDGTGPANASSLLVSLPAAFTWKDTVGISGNSSRTNTRDPIPNSSLVDYGDFTVPARSDSGAGVLVISFHAICQQGTAAGRYTASAQFTDDTGLIVTVRDTVPVNVVP